MDKYNGNLQYVGARYVPKIAEPYEYDPEMTYEPLTIVGYKNASYTSKKYVPAGVNPTTTEYWANTGNYNAQVEQYRRETAEYKNSVGQYKSQVDEYQASVNEYKNAVTNIDKKTQNTLVQIDTIAKLKQYKGEYPVLLMGYYAAGDNEPIVYNIASAGTDDGGSTIRLDNGKFAVAVLGDYVTPDTFGCQSTNDVQATACWTKFARFIKDNAKSVRLLGKNYNVFAPLEIPNDIVGVTGISKLTAKARIPVISATQSIENISMNHSAVIWAANVGDNVFRTINGFTVDCNGLCDTGIFLVNRNRTTIENIKVENPLVSGIALSRVWETVVNNIFISCASVSCKYPFIVGGLDGEYTSNTSITINNMYVNSVSKNVTAVYKFENLCYSNIGSIFVDSIAATNIFDFHNCHLSIAAIGSEHTTSTEFLKMRNSNLDIGAVTAESNVTYSNFFRVEEASSLVAHINRVKNYANFVLIPVGNKSILVELTGLSLTDQMLDPKSANTGFLVFQKNYFKYRYWKDSHSAKDLIT